jgi:4-amino-4-deoxy-L-arabinose transferase-like glycosyltransferase
MMQRNSNPARIWLVLLLAAALAIRLAWGFILPSDAESLARLPDQAGYLEMGRNLLHGQGLTWIDPRFGDRTYAVRMPGYPLLVAACAGNVHAVRIVQALIDTSIVLAIYLLARHWLTGGMSLFAAALVAFNPFLVYFSGLILSETLFVALLAWGMLLLSANISFLWGGLLLAISLMVRPSVAVLPVLLGITGVLLPGAVKPRRWPLPVGSSMLVLMALMVLPWAIRNRLVLGQWVLTTTNNGFVLYDGFNPDADGSSNQAILQSPEWKSRLRDLDEVARNEVLKESAIQFISDTWKQRPQWLAKLTARKILRTWSPVPLSAEFGSRRLYWIAAIVFSIPFDVLIVLGLWQGGLPRKVKFYLLLPAVYFTVVHALSVGSLRYRLPAEPILAILAAAGMAQAWLAVKARKHSVMTNDEARMTNDESMSK